VKHITRIFHQIKGKVYTTFEYFGEASILLGTPRMADVTALTSVEAYSIDKESFLRFITNTKVEKTIKQLASTRSASTWTAIKANPFFKDLSSSQVTQLKGILSSVDINKETSLFKEGEKSDHIFILIEGCVRMEKKKVAVKTCEKGEIIGDVFAIKDKHPMEVMYKAEPKTKLYRIEGKDILNFLEENPGVFINMMFAKGSIKQDA
jgi:CRP-like cAMP-binding protein